MKLKILPKSLSILRFSPDEKIPEFSTGDFYSMTRTKNEVSIICENPPKNFSGKIESLWRAFFISGTLDFSLVGILKKIADPLAKVKISIFVISTFDTDFVLVPERDFFSAQKALVSAGFLFIK